MTKEALFSWIVRAAIALVAIIAGTVMIGVFVAMLLIFSILDLAAHN